jgi:hypothetical protein
MSEVEWDDPFARLVPQTGHCFLCGDALGGAGTQEHVFPAWLLHRHALWDARLHLLNRTTIPYRRLTVPCCRTCNNEDLARLEKEVAGAFSGGYSEVAALDEVVVFQWAAKIFLGMLFKETTLSADRADRSKGPMMTSEYLRSLDLLHGLLQSARRPIDFVGSSPFSVLVANLHELPEPLAFSFYDNLRLLTFSLRSRDVGIIVSFQDGQMAAESYGQYLTEVGGRKLHPMQFDELFAKVTYEARRMSHRPGYIWSLTPEREEPCTVIMNQSAYIREWNQEEFATLLATVMARWDVSSGDLFAPPDRVATWMSDESGGLLLVDNTGEPIK